MGSAIYARMLDTGSSKGPSTNVGFSFPSYSNLLNISCVRENVLIYGGLKPKSKNTQEQ